LLLSGGHRGCGCLCRRAVGVVHFLEYVLHAMPVNTGGDCADQRRRTQRIGHAAAAGRQDEALAAYRRALAIDAEHAETYYNLAESLRKTAQSTPAIAAYRRSIALDPNIPGAYLNLGIALRASGALAEAIACYDKAAALDPTHLPTRSNRLCALHFHPQYGGGTRREEHSE